MKSLTTQELADRWGVREGTLRNWRSLGKGPQYKKVGEGPRGYIVYDKSDVAEYESKYNIMARRQPSKPKSILRKNRSAK